MKWPRIDINRDASLAAFFVCTPEPTVCIATIERRRRDELTAPVITHPFFLSSQPADFCAIALTPDGNQVFTGSIDRAVRLWDISSRQLLSVTTPAIGIPYSLRIQSTPNSNRTTCLLAARFVESPSPSRVCLFNQALVCLDSVELKSGSFDFKYPLLAHSTATKHVILSFGDDARLRLVRELDATDPDIKVFLH